MSKRITVEELAANLREHLAEVEAGETLVVVEDEQEIATLAPPMKRQQGVRYPFRDLKLSPPINNLTIDPVEALIEDRERDRSGIKFDR